MTNIWTNTFEEIRKPHFNIEDPYTALEEKKNYTPSKDQDGDGDNDFADNMVARMVASGKMTKAQAVAKTKNKSYNKEEVDRTAESQAKKIDVRRGIDNYKKANGKPAPVNLNPTIREEVEEWVGELVEEGYDLSEFTWNEITDIYLSEADSSLAPVGDAQTIKQNPPQAKDKNDALKRNVAQAQIRRDMADAKLAKASQYTNESAILYLIQRPDPFANIEEGVFDPKKSKMRPASERAKGGMTDAQRKAAKKEDERIAQIHSKGETVLTGLRSKGKSSQPMGTTQTSKAPAPKANRTVKGKYDTLAKKASDVLKDVQN